jgi:hypothetical protein
LFLAKGSIETFEFVRYDCTKSLIGGTLKVSPFGMAHVLENFISGEFVAAYLAAG